MRASLPGPDFFDAERHPEITFHSTAVRLADDGRAEVDARGMAVARNVVRPYRQKVRAERAAETRQRIIESAVALHLERGPALTQLYDHFNRTEPAGSAVRLR
jgi:hypothetical protein